MPAKIARRIFVEQRSGADSIMRYQVTKLFNMLEPIVGFIVTREELQRLIDDGVEVTVGK